MADNRCSEIVSNPWFERAMILGSCSFWFGICTWECFFLGGGTWYIYIYIFFFFFDWNLLIYEHPPFHNRKLVFTFLFIFQPSMFHQNFWKGVLDFERELLPIELAFFFWAALLLPSRELTYPTWGKGKSSSNMPYQGDMLISWRVTRDILGFLATLGVTLKPSFWGPNDGWLVGWIPVDLRKICWWRIWKVSRSFFFGIGNKRLGGSKNKSRHIIIMMMIIIIISYLIYIHPDGRGNDIDILTFLPVVECCLVDIPFSSINEACYLDYI